MKETTTYDPPIPARLVADGSKVEVLARYYWTDDNEIEFEVRFVDNGWQATVSDWALEF